MYDAPLVGLGVIRFHRVDVVCLDDVLVVTTQYVQPLLVATHGVVHACHQHARLSVPRVQSDVVAPQTSRDLLVRLSTRQEHLPVMNGGCGRRQSHVERRLHDPLVLVDEILLHCVLEGAAAVPADGKDGAAIADLREVMSRFLHRRDLAPRVEARVVAIALDAHRVVRRVQLNAATHVHEVVEAAHLHVERLRVGRSERRPHAVGEVVHA